MDVYRDTLSVLNQSGPLIKKLTVAHEKLKERFDFTDRIALAIYDQKTDELRTFIHSSGGAQPLLHYQAKLSDAHSLLDVIQSGNPRVINDLAVFSNGTQEHTQLIAAAGYQASYTLPMFINSAFFGFIFFNSYRKNVFDREVLHYLDLFGHLIALVAINEVGALRTLAATARAARDLARLRDTETGAHLDRMSHFSRIVAVELAQKYDYNDEYIEYLFLFAPLHDIGKIGIPDSILLKGGPLTGDERDLMKTHVVKGREFVDSLLENFGSEVFSHLDVLRNIVEYHHEAIDGSGYPRGACGDQIPIEARIIAVADVFDALTSRRPYKEGWSNDTAFATLRQLSGSKLDPDCVEALIKQRASVEEIQQRFQEAFYA